MLLIYEGILTVTPTIMVRPHSHNNGLTPNEAGRRFWESSKTVAQFT